jgi:protein-L-isoaspartate(D-aspartate) O-methyltransferase
MYTNSELVNHLINTNVLYSSGIIDAFSNVDRADFVAQSDSYDTYGDFPLQIGWGQSISQPTTVAMMLEMLNAQKGDKVLDIGSGSGWTTALLSYIVGDEGSVTGVERIDELVEFGNKNLNKYRFKNSKIVHAKDKLGIEGEKFERILVSAAADEFPMELSEQLKTGGKMVIPVENYIYEVSKRADEELEIIKHYGFVFVPLIR